jgi:hypothetical protein
VLDMPPPLLLEVLVEAIGVLQALDVAAGTGIAVPVPRAADAAAGLQHRHREAGLAQIRPVQDDGPPIYDLVSA